MAMNIGGVDVETVLFPALAATGGGVITVPAGISAGYFTMGASNVWFRGEGKECSILQFVSGGLSNFLIDGGGAAFYQNTHFTDVCFDGNGDALLIALIRAPGYGTDRWTFERCWFKNFPLGFAGAQVTGCRFKDCLFTAEGDIVGNAIQLSEGCHDIEIVGNEFNWISMGCSVEASEIANERIRFLRNRVRQDYWAIKPFNSAQATGVGGTVSYTPTALIDTARNFPLIPFDQLRNMRAMEVLIASNTTNIGNTLLVDGAADFPALGPKYGDLVRTAAAWSMVIGVEPGNVTRLVIDGWKDLVTYLPTTPPIIGAAYTLYRLYIGETDQYVGATQINTTRWRDLLGNTIGPPPNGTLYEILGNRASGGINFEENVQSCIIADNIMHGGWADQITSRGPRAVLANNVCNRGQDMGCTLSGEGSVIIGGQYSYNGASGIVIPNGRNMAIIGVTSVDNNCEFISGPYGNNLQIEGDRILVANCISRKVEGNPNLLYGIYVRGLSPGCWLLDNAIDGFEMQIGGEAGIADAQTRALFAESLWSYLRFNGEFKIPS